MPQIHEFPAPPRASSSSSRPTANGHSSSFSNGHASSSSRANGHAHADCRSPTLSAPDRDDVDAGEGEESMILDDGDAGSESDRSASDDDEEEGDGRIELHVEVRLKLSCSHMSHTIQQMVCGWLLSNDRNPLKPGKEITGWESVDVLKRAVDLVRCGEAYPETSCVYAGEADLNIHVYKPGADGPLEEFSARLDEDDDEGSNNVHAASIRQLPSREIDGLWSNLIYEDDIKERLLRYISSGMTFSEREVDGDVISWNRLVLLHGPPGTGKTSLCRALAQKLSIRFAQRYQYGQLVEINSHSLFSKWFSESGKLVQKLFQRVAELVADENGFVVVMIDEVESLTSGRAQAIAGNEPTDAIRSVNALLTQLDKLKTKKNVLVVTTSNLSDAIDPAFLDRADLKAYVGPPPASAIYWMLSGALAELVKRKLMKRVEFPSWEFGSRSEVSSDESRSQKLGRELASIAELCHSREMTGRFLRRLPLLAHANYLSSSAGSDGMAKRRSPEKWLEAMRKVIEGERKVKGE